MGANEGPCEWGTYEGPEGEVGFEVQVTGGGEKGDGVTSCGFVRTVGDCKERKYDYTVSGRMWKQQCVMEVDCKGAVGTHVRVVLPGAKRIFAVEGVRVHRHRPLPPSRSVVDAVAAARGFTTGVNADANRPRPMVRKDLLTPKEVRGLGGLIASTPSLSSNARACVCACM